MATVDKRIRISDDNGSTYYTLPGNQAELTNEAGEIVDTIWQEAFESAEIGLIGWRVSTNALYKGFAGYVATIKKAGTPTSMTDEAMSQVGSSKTYQIDDATKQVFDRSATLTFEDDASAVDADNIESIDYLFGRVTFVSSYTPSGDITVSGNYMPLATMGKGRSFTLTQTAQAVDNTDMPGAQANSGHRTFEYGLKGVSFELGGVYAVASGLRALLTARSEVIIEVNPDGSSKSVARGFFKATNQGQSGDIGNLEEETISFRLNVPEDDKLELPFKWVHASDTTLSLSIRKLITAWEDKNTLDVRYLPDGSTGLEGDVLVTEISLSGGLEAMNDFSATLQGTGQPSAV